MNATIERTKSNTIELTITIPWKDIQSKYEIVLNKLVGEIELPGFRKGKAPRDLAEKQINKNKVYEEAIQQLIPNLYAEAVKTHDVRPIISPKIELIEAEEGKDWKLKATTAERPTIKLGNYKKAVAALKESKKSKIWVPGEEKKTGEKPVEPTIGEILDALAKEIETELSPVLVEQEMNRMLSNLINETQKLGMTVEQYLQAQGKTIESIRHEYTVQAQNALSMEFGLEAIADAEKVTVEDAEVDSVINNAKTEQEKQALAGQKYYITSLLRRQKTLNSLMSSPTIAK